MREISGKYTEEQKNRNLINQYQKGFRCNNSCADVFIERIRNLADDEKLCMRMGKNARFFSEEGFARNCTYIKLIEMIERR